MTALAAPKVGSYQRGVLTGFPIRYAYPIADNVKIYPGALIALAAGYVQPATTATGLIILGQYQGPNILDNTGTGHAAGAFVVDDIVAGIIELVNSGTDAFAASDRGALVYAEDDQTVGKVATGKSIAGVLYEFVSTSIVEVFCPGLIAPFL